MEDKLILDLSMPCHMQDAEYRLKPNSFMDLAQDIAIYGADQLGFGDKTIVAKNAAWILSRMRFTYVRPIRRHERFKMETWHRGLNGLFFIRDYRILGEDGQLAMLGTSSWVIMDISTRRLVRNDSMTDVVDFTPQNTESAIEDPAPKVAMPRGVEPEPVGEHVVLYSDIDVNHHANNAKYIQWAMDALPLDLTTEKSVKDVTINFNKEARPGESVALYHVATEDGAHIVEGRTDQQVFICRIAFE